MARRKNISSPDQLTLWQSVVDVYLKSGGDPLDNGTLYDRVCERAGIDRSEIDARTPIGRAGAPHSTLARTIRWTQQTLRQRGVIQRTQERGVWRLTREAKTELHQIERGFVVLGFSTRLGMALVADCRDAMASIDEPISLVLTSLPYLLSRPRAYGNPKSVSEYIDFVCAAIEPVLPKLVAGASLVLSVTNDSFAPSSPARTLTNEKLLIALNEKLGLQRIDTLIWACPNKAPGPIQWASKTRQQLNVGYEPLLWLALDPSRVFADNRRVLMPHSDRHLKLIARGGEQREGIYSDGRYRINRGAFSNPTEGRIPRNVLNFGHSCQGQRQYKRDAAALGLPVHGAPWPESLVEFLVAFLTTEGMLVADIMAGSQTTPVVCERMNRRWVSCDRVFEYVRGGAVRFPGAQINPWLDEVIANRSTGLAA